MSESPGKLLRETRRRHGLSQQRLATRAGTTQSAISRIEHDRLSPTIETLTSLLSLMGEELSLSAKPIDYGHDRAMLRQNLALSPDERVQRATQFANFVLRNRGAALKGNGE